MQLLSNYFDLLFYSQSQQYISDRATLHLVQGTYAVEESVVSLAPEQYVTDYVQDETDKLSYCRGTARRAVI